MKILAIDTSTEACSAALLTDGEVIQRYQIAPRQHAELILGMCDELLAESNCKLSELDAIAFGRGPGAFTGVRIATGVVQGIAFAHDLPVVPVSSLAAMAFAAWTEKKTSHAMTAIDARMGEVYWACYECNDAGVKEIVAEQVCPPDQVDLPTSDSWVGIGSGWDTYQQELKSIVGESIMDIDGNCFPQAQHIAMLAALSVEKGEVLAAAQAMPVYLRDNVAKKKAEQKS
ncbi:MAG: tRNA (adenosine(37)-N6)-threonylcarbamoyltransferase complex dimerization subunit type 1 TsaB [Sulfuriflexus sp.]|nr:tRNA (adenosine(37)-N6)-threonylcarbamoyltransferase complex dimerization subunit type 1 TsaB [Sulfuriflexus sp.]